MGPHRSLRERFERIIDRRQADRELDEELHFHLEQEAQRLQRMGVEAGEARRRARLSFGGYDRVIEETRAARPFARLDAVWRDVRFGARGLRRERGFTIVAALTLGLGVGATTAVFALADWLLIRPLPGVSGGDRLVGIRFEYRSSPARVSVPNYEDLRRATPAFAALAGESGVPLHVQPAAGAPVGAFGGVVLGDYFGTLGVVPERGRFFSEEERDPSRGGDVIVISGRFARQLFGSADAAVGEVLDVNRARLTVVGVTGRGFLGATRQSDLDVWLPPALLPGIHHAADMLDVMDRAAGLFTLVGRLAPGATPSQAETQLAQAAARLFQQYPDEAALFENYLPRVDTPLGLRPEQRERAERTLRLVLGIVVVLLVIACANLASLLLGRALARRSEIAVRRALGASGGRIAQQHLIEAALLAVIGGAAAVAVAFVLSGSFEGLALLGFIELDRVELGLRVLVFALAAALLCSAVAGVLPAVFGRSVGAGLSAYPARSTPQGRARSSLTVLQIAASLALLIASGLLVRTVRNLQAVELGFDADQVYAFSFIATPQGWDAARLTEVNHGLVDRLRERAGPDHVTLASGRPFASQYIVPLAAPAAEPDTPPGTFPAYYVTAGFFRTLGIPVVRGRTFTDDEARTGTPAGSAGGIVLSRSAAQRIFGDVDPVGLPVHMGRRSPTEYRVIGVVEDMYIADLRSPPDAVAYFPIGEWQLPMFAVLVRSPLGQPAVERMVEAARAEVAPSLPLPEVAPLSAHVQRSIGEERLLARLLSLFALLAVTLAGIGLYGVVAYGVARRRREIGIRMALGARGAAVIALVARQSLTLLAVGAVLGVAGGYALSRVLASRMFGVTPLDPLTYAAAVAGFALVAALASVVPARTAARVDPAATLKVE